MRALKLKSVIFFLLCLFYFSGSIFFCQKQIFANEIPGLNIKKEWGGGISQIFLDGVNIVNESDTGRLIQLSIYDFSDPINNWPWNPVQGGDYQGRGSVLLDSLGETYVKTQPLLWNGGNNGGYYPSDVYFEQWIESIKPNVYKVRYRVTNLGTRVRSGLHELPAMYINSPFSDIVYYEGSSPWTNGQVRKITQADLEKEGKKDLGFYPSERWTGVVNGNNRGLFIYEPDAELFYWWPTVHGVGGLYYLSPKQNIAFSPGVSPEYYFYLITGSVDDARKEIYYLNNLNCASVPKPVNLTVTCINPGNRVRISWDGQGQAASYGVRVDDNDKSIDSSNLLSGALNTCSPHDVCINGWTGNVMDITVDPEKTYTWWLHSANSCGGWSNAVKGIDFKCAPDCTGLSGPSEIVLGQSGMYSANFFSSTGHLYGGFSVGQDNNATWHTNPFRQWINGTSGTLSFIWTPEREGVHDVYCRAWNNDTTECVGNANYAKGPPVYSCASSNSSIKVMVVKPSASSGSALTASSYEFIPMPSSVSQTLTSFRSAAIPEPSPTPVPQMVLSSQPATDIELTPTPTPIGFVSAYSEETLGSSSVNLSSQSYILGEQVFETRSFEPESLDESGIIKIKPLNVISDKPKENFKPKLNNVYEVFLYLLYLLI